MPECGYETGFACTYSASSPSMRPAPKFRPKTSTNSLAILKGRSVVSNVKANGYRLCPALPHAAHHIITLRLSRAAHQRSWRPRMFDGGADESRERELHHGRN